MLTKEDLLASIRLYKLDQILDEDDTILDLVFAEAESDMINLLSDNYNTESIFSQTGSARNASVIGWGKHLALYKLYARIPDEQVPARVIKDYDNTMELLVKIAEGKFPVSLPKRIEPDGKKKTKILWGSDKKRTH